MKRRRKTLVEEIEARDRRNGRVLPLPPEGYPAGQRMDCDDSPPAAEYAGDHTLDARRGVADSGGAPWPRALSAAAYHGLVGEIVHAIEPHSEADPAALLVQALVAFGSVIGRTAHFVAEQDCHYLNLFAVLVGRTSKGRKGSSWNRVIQLLDVADPTWADQHPSGLSSGEGLIWAVRDPIRSRQAVKEHSRVVGHEEVETDPGVSDKRLLVYEPEFAVVLKHIETRGNILSHVLRLAWDGLTLRTMVKNSPAVATGAHVSLVGHITAEELRRHLSATETANGFGNRFLWLCVQRSKELPEGGSVPVNVLAKLRGKLADAIAFARDVATMRRDDAARVRWRDVYGPLSAGRPGLTGALLARAEAQVMRVACLYALLDRSCLVECQHLDAALALWDYCEASARCIFGDSLGDPVADEILRVLRSTPAGLTRTEIRDLFGGNRPANEIGRALGLLVEYRLARQERRDTGGRPSERWFASCGATR
jgi:hypothetical protein